jgi:hypothetical protein
MRLLRDRTNLSSPSSQTSLSPPQLSPLSGSTKPVPLEGTPSSPRRTRKRTFSNPPPPVVVLRNDNESQEPADSPSDSSHYPTSSVRTDDAPCLTVSTYTYTYIFPTTIIPVSRPKRLPDAKFQLITRSREARLQAMRMEKERCQRSVASIILNRVRRRAAPRKFRLKPYTYVPSPLSGWVGPMDGGA